MCPKIIDKKVKKQDILEAAINVFAQQGIPNTKMIDIAVKAGIGKGTIYEYFRSKEELIKEAFRSYIVKLDKAAVHKMEEADHPIDKLCNIIDGWMGVIETSYEESKVMIDFWAQGLRLNRVIEEFNLKEIYHNYRTLLSGIIKQGISREKIHPVDPNLMASVIIATLDGIVLHWIIGKEFFDLKDAVELFKKSTIDPLRKI